MYESKYSAFNIRWIVGQTSLFKFRMANGHEEEKRWTQNCFTPLDLCYTLLMEQKLGKYLIMD